MKLSKTQANLLLLISAFIWGISFTFIKQATNAHMPIGLLNASRGLIFACLIYLFFHKSINKMTLSDLRFGMIGGLLNFSIIQLQSTGLKYTTPSNSAFLTAIYVLFVPFISWLVFRQQPKAKVYLAIALCLVGMVFLTGIIDTGFHVLLGDTLTLLCALFVSIQIVYFSYIGYATSPFIMAFMLGMSLFLFGSVYSFLFEKTTYSAIDWSEVIIPILFLGVAASFFAQTLQIFSQKFTDSTTAGLLLMTESLFASGVSVVVGLEPLTHNLLIGGTLTFCSLLIIQIDFSKFSIYPSRSRNSSIDKV